MSPKFFTRANVSAAIIGLSLLIMVLVTAGCTYARRGETPDGAWAQYSEGLKHELRKGRNADLPPAQRD